MRQKRPTLRLLDVALQIRTNGITAPSLQSVLLPNSLLHPTRTKVLPTAVKKRWLVPKRKGRLSDVGEQRRAYSGFISTALLPTETSQAKLQEKYQEEIVRLDEHLSPALTRFLREDAGISFAEYALVASLIAVVCVIALLALGKGT